MSNSNQELHQQVLQLAAEVDLSGDSELAQNFLKRFGFEASHAASAITSALHFKNITPVSLNESFASWFQHSRVVNSANEPLVVFHGTTKDIAAFRANKNGRGLYFTESPGVASTYAQKNGGDGANIIPVHLSLQNPLVVDAKGGHWASIPFNGSTNSLDYLCMIAKEAGHDGVIARNIQDLSDMDVPDDFLLSSTYVAFDPRQVKSALGSDHLYDPESTKITSIDNPAQNKKIKQFCKGVTARHSPPPTTEPSLEMR